MKGNPPPVLEVDEAAVRSRDVGTMNHTNPALNRAILNVNLKPIGRKAAPVEVLVDELLQSGFPPRHSPNLLGDTTIHPEIL